MRVSADSTDPDVLSGCTDHKGQDAAVLQSGICNVKDVSRILACGFHGEFLRDLTFEGVRGMSANCRTD